MYQAPEVLLEQSNNRGTMHAVVEQDNRVAYCYVFPAEKLPHEFKPRPCWLRNIQAAPTGKDLNAMNLGMAPMLEAKFVNHPDGQAPLEAARVSILWSEAGDGVTVFYDDEIIGIIPGWSLYTDQPVAYAKDCIDADDDSMVFPYNPAKMTTLNEQVDKAKAFWAAWEDESGEEWATLQGQYIAAYETVFGTLEKYYSIDGDTWPPMALGQFEKDGIVYFASLGMSIRPMPWVDFLYNDNAAGFRRMELAVAIKKSDFTEQQIMQFAEILSGIADSPWRNVTWFGEGHTVGSQSLEAPYESLILSSALYNGEAINMPMIYGEPVNLFWAMPISEGERKYAHEVLNGGFTLLEELINAGNNHVVKQREFLY
ncbi:suppressor of fused protein SUFU [Chitinophaga skermanii]|uniref:Suppressor of fused protein SUFU n=1 Tax=Chitinophaga skermanii TaxID=331697 RepID=A0A327Q9I1_9BACT|nr:suppressor of fused domain protein [Chitinophaga skermanii]RAI99842.1 suppressor of fused protein SUFU [Chitinophaga skermanii]